MSNLSTENKTKTEMDEDPPTKKENAGLYLDQPQYLSLSYNKMSTTFNYQLIPQQPARPLRQNTSACIEDQKRKRMRPGQQLYLYP